eukprot:TRINITY_DN91499_c0_g1_i1.p1 TRINITY_DN91499_c0_g1~~TRINITY_DN91499_c0_g1_i1.p1  ORF type:complete len:353 (+),score=86.70 TRINITY_DN91499_c0_g1_i1:125-1183(+)
MEKAEDGWCQEEPDDSCSKEETEDGWCDSASKGLMELLGAERQRLRAELRVLRATPWPKPGATAVLRRQWYGGVTGGAWPRNELSAASRHQDKESPDTDGHSGDGMHTRDLAKQGRWIENRLLQEQQQLVRSAQAVEDGKERRARVVRLAVNRAEAVWPVAESEHRLQALQARLSSLREQLVAAEAQCQEQTDAAETLRQGREAAEACHIAEQERVAEELSQLRSVLAEQRKCLRDQQADTEKARSKERLAEELERWRQLRHDNTASTGSRMLLSNISERLPISPPRPRTLFEQGDALESRWQQLAQSIQTPPSAIASAMDTSAAESSDRESQVKSLQKLWAEQRQKILAGT